MSMPADANVIAQRIYEEIAPVTYADSDNDYALLHFIHAWTNSMMQLENIVRDTDAGPGWSSIMDPDTAPDMFLTFLSYMVGSVPVRGENPAQARLRIEGMTGIRRGSAQAMRAAAQRYLTGNKYVIFNERASGNAWHLEVRTLTSETPDEDQVRAELLLQKPAGVVMTYDTIDGVEWNAIIAAYDSWQEVLDSYSSWGQVIVDLPD